MVGGPQWSGRMPLADLLHHGEMWHWGMEMVAWYRSWRTVTDEKAGCFDSRSRKGNIG